MPQRCPLMTSSVSGAELDDGEARQHAGVSRRHNVLALILILFLAWGASEVMQRHNQDQAQTRLDEMSQRIARRIAVRVNLYQYGLRGLGASMHAVGLARWQRDHFDRYSNSRDVEREFPGARGFGFIRRVPQAQTADFLRSAQQDGRPDFALRQLAPHAGERWIIQYIAPDAANRSAEGLDVASEPNRREAVRRAITEGEPALTQPLTLLQATGKREQGFLLVMPLFQHPYRHDTEASRQNDVVGMIYCPLIIDEVLAKVELHADELALSLDSQSQGQSKRFFQQAAFERAVSAFSSHQPITIFGAAWQMTVRPTPVFFQRLNQTSPAMLGIAVAGGLGGALALLNFVFLAKRRRIQLQDHRIRLAAIVENSNDAIIGKSIDGVVATWNHAAERMFGFSAREAIGHSIAELVVPPELQAEERQILARLRRGEKIANFITRRRRKDGTEIEVSISSSPIVNPAGEIIGAAKIAHDVTEQQQAARQIQELNTTLEQRVEERTAQLDEARQALRTVLDAMPSMVAFWDQAGVNRFANRAYQDWFGVSPDQLYGRHIRELLGESLYACNLPFITQALAGEAQTFERDIPYIDGHGVRHAVAHYLPNRVDGAVTGFYAIVHDVTELIESRNQLAQAREEQFRMDRLASLGLMVAGVAHELNTPLGAAMLALDKLGEDLGQFRQAQAKGLRKSDVERIAQQFDHGLSMASRYLARSAEIIRQFKQVASDRAGAERRLFMADEVIRDVIHLLDARVRKAGASLTLALAPGLEMDSYPGILGQVVQNLVENALLHGTRPNQPVRITVSLTAEGAGVRLQVSDTGPGVPEALRERIWDPFFTTRRSDGGTGLGLHIVLRLVTELLGGSISQSPAEAEQGCRFSLNLPMQAPKQDGNSELPANEGNAD